MYFMRNLYGFAFKEEEVGSKIFKKSHYIIYGRPPNIDDLATLRRKIFCILFFNICEIHNNKIWKLSCKDVENFKYLKIDWMIFFVWKRKKNFAWVSLDLQRIFWENLRCEFVRRFCEERGDYGMKIWRANEERKRMTKRR